MTPLDTYMKANDLSDEAFGKSIKRSRMQVYRYRHGIQVPGRKTMSSIIKATGGEVTANSFYDVVVKKPSTSKKKARHLK